MTIDIYVYLIVLPFMFLAGFVDAIAGGGALIALPGMFIAGLPAHTALGTNKFGALFGTAFTFIRYLRNGFIDLKLAFIIAVFTISGAALGTNLVLMVSSNSYKIALLVGLPITAFYLLRKRALRDYSEEIPYNKLLLRCILITFIVGIYDGFYGPGAGTFLLLGFCAFAHMSVQKSNGLTKAENMISDITSMILFLIHGDVLFPLAIGAAITNIAGNYLGAKFFEKKGAFATRPIMIVVISLFILKVGYDVITGQ